RRPQRDEGQGYACHRLLLRFLARRAPRASLAQRHPCRTGSHVHAARSRDGNRQAPLPGRDCPPLSLRGGFRAGRVFHFRLSPCRPRR
ncbi:MAG: hypothetical protein KH300_17135, partial [Sanguibacteroides justesenii]|nr:hypothetical protein [Sanguibacteroides justesenii]